MASNEAYLKEVSKFTAQMKKLKGQEVVVGIPAAKNKKHDGTVTTVAELGAIHEYGAPDANIPQRSFLRVPLASNAKNLFKFIEKELKFSKINTDKALGKLGARGQSVVLQAFKTQGNSKWSQLKPSTLRQRVQGKGSGSTKPLIDTGQLRQSITFEVREA